jgi:hypothetical protein
MSLNMVMGWLCCKIQDAGERGKKEVNECQTENAEYCSYNKRQDVHRFPDSELRTIDFLLTYPCSLS